MSGMDQPQPQPPSQSKQEPQTRNDFLSRRASYISLVVSVLLLAFKLWGYMETRSQAVFSDAMETIVNVITAGLAIVVIIVALKPADRDHPYGHGKIEFFSAAFEGGLIAFASLLICIESIKTFWHGATIQQPGLGIVITLGAGFINAGLGVYLLQVGKRNQSAALQASGQHVLSDFWTSLGVSVGLILVSATGIVWFDPLCALIVGLWLGWTGLKLVRRSASGLLDEEDIDLLKNLATIVDRDRPPGIIQVHHVRVIRSGSYHHIDAHAVVPEYWDVLEAHVQTDNFENMLMRDYAYSGELHLHVDPCRRAYCSHCEVRDCPIRRCGFTSRLATTLEEFINPEEPHEFQ